MLQRLKKVLRMSNNTPRDTIGGMKTMENLVTVAEASKLYEVSRIYIRKLCQRGKLKARNFGGSWVIDRGSADSFFAKPRKRGRKPVDK